MPKLEFDIAVKDVGLKELNKLIREQTQLTSELIMQYGKEADVAKKAGAALGQLKNEKREVVKATTELSGGVKRSSAQLLEMGENITVVSAGIVAAISSFTSFAKQIYDFGLAGAQLTNMSNHFIDMSGGIQQATYNMELLSAATAGTFDDRQLISFANKMAELGYTTGDTARLLDIAETASDNLGVTIEDASQSLLKFFETGKGRGLFNFGIDIAKVNDKMKEMSGLTDTQIQKLSVENQEMLRRNATFQLYGKTLDDIKKKQKDTADEIESSSVALKNLGNSFAQALAPSVAIAANVLVGFVNTLSRAKVNMASYNEEAMKSEKVTENISKILAEAKINADNMADAYKNIGNAIMMMTKAQVESAKDFVNAEIAKIESLIEESKQLQINYYLKQVGDVAFKTAEQQAEMFKNAWANAQGYTANIQKLKELLGQLDSRGKFLEDPGGDTKTKGKEKKEADPLTEAINAINTRIRLEELQGIITTERYNAAIQELRLLIETNTEEEKRVRILEEVAKYQKKIYEYSNSMTSLKDVSLTDTTTRNLSIFTGGTSFIQSKDISVLIQQLSEPFSNAAESISNIFSDLMSAWEINTETFIGKLVDGFSKVLSIVNLIVNTLNAVNAVKGLIGAIGSIIPGGGLISAAAGGMSGGMPMPMLQSGNSRPIVNVVVHSEVEKTKAIKFFDNNFNAYLNHVRENSH